MRYELISELSHKALKRYRCIWCGEHIPIGTRYVREFSVYDGDVQKHAWHPECKGAADEFFRESCEDEFAPWENERPMSHAEQEFRSWDCSLLAQGALVCGPNQVFTFHAIGDLNDTRASQENPQPCT